MILWVLLKPAEKVTAETGQAGSVTHSAMVLNKLFRTSTSPNVWRRLQKTSQPDVCYSFPLLHWKHLSEKPPPPGDSFPAEEDGVTSAHGSLGQHMQAAFWSPRVKSGVFRLAQGSTPLCVQGQPHTEFWSCVWCRSHRWKCDNQYNMSTLHQVTTPYSYLSLICFMFPIRHQQQA